MISHDADIAILGAGLSGSLTALALADVVDPARLLLIDAAEHPLAGRRWACTAGEPLAPGTDLAVWDRIGVRSADADLVLALRRSRYRRISGDLLAQRLRERRVPLLRAKATALVPGPASASIRLSDGTVLRARQVLDSVFGVPAVPASPRLSFRGLRIRLPRTPDHPVLMDLRMPQGPGVRFGYLLPEGPGRAFAEATSFTTDGADEGLAVALPQWLDAAWPGWQPDSPVLEEASLPLLRRGTGPRGGAVLCIGARAGRLRRSTGYGAAGYARDARRIAAAAARTGRLPALPVPHTQHAMDAVALQLLREDPAALARAYVTMFARSPADDVLQFIDTGLPAPSLLRLLVRLPARPFAAAAWHLAIR